MFKLGWRGQRVWKLKAKGGGWDPWSLSPMGPHTISSSPKAVTLKSTAEARYRYKCLFYIKISQNGQLVVPRPLVKGWRRGRGVAVQEGNTDSGHSHWAGAKPREGGAQPWPRPLLHALACTLLACQRATGFGWGHISDLRSPETVGRREVPLPGWLLNTAS